MNSDEWLRGFLGEFGGVAGTVHRVGSDGVMVIDAAVNIPPQVIEATRRIPSGKGMAGIALAEDRCVSTCNLKEDQTGAVKPGAKAVGAAAAVAIPVHAPGGQVRAVVGIAWPNERTLADEELARIRRAAEALS